MSANAHHCCIVFSTNKQSALNKLEKIASNKTLIRKWVGADKVLYQFEDEEWIWVNPAVSTRGFRAHKAAVDIQCTIEQLEYVIKPSCELYCEQFEYYDNYD